MKSVKLKLFLFYYIYLLIAIMIVFMPVFILCSVIIKRDIMHDMVTKVFKMMDIMVRNTIFDN
tara:strand:- start:1978 stop:2166 length:189 start_codon:yes stop_codon:yes gene_type:complete